jgi:gamma-glutamyltranspeptidase
MVVSLTETILAAYGSMVTTPAGMLMNNAMFAFVPVPGFPNSVAPGHRPQSSMSPVVVVDRTGRPILAAGASGGRRISAAVMQVVIYVLDHGLPAQDAVATPRLDVVGDTVLLDDRMPDDTAAALERRGTTSSELRRTCPPCTSPTRPPWSSPTTGPCTPESIRCISPQRPAGNQVTSAWCAGRSPMAGCLLYAC